MAPIQFRFNEEKATQVASRLVERSGGRMNCLVLMKLVYMIDRTSMAKWGHPVSGGKYTAMRKGMLISEAYDAVKAAKDKNCDELWAKHLGTVNNFSVLKESPGTSRLSPAQIDLIDDVHAMFAHANPWKLVEKLHDDFQEWSNPHGTKKSKPVSVEKIFRVLKKSPDEIKSIAKETAYHQQVQNIFGP